MKFIYFSLAWLLLGYLNLRFIDRSGDTQWLVMLGDKRNVRSGKTWFWFWAAAITSWVTWPLNLFFHMRVIMVVFWIQWYGWIWTILRFAGKNK